MLIRVLRHDSWLHRWRSNVPELGWWSPPCLFRWSAYSRAVLAVQRHRATTEEEV